MVKKITAWGIAKPLLERDFINGEAMRHGYVHQLRPEHTRVPIGNFGSNWNRMKKTIGAI